jgi:hypothetical protein
MLEVMPHFLSDGRLARLGKPVQWPFCVHLPLFTRNATTKRNLQMPHLFNSFKQCNFFQITVPCHFPSSPFADSDS